MSLLKIILYTTASKKQPFKEWLSSIDQKSQTIVLARLDRISLSNFGDCKSIGSGIFELRIQYGPGYRIYLQNEELASLFY